MRELNFKVRFTTPAFLGNAEQNGQWRTPPFKALLRQWWRVAWAADHGFSGSISDMRREEGLLFGHAWLEDDRDREGRVVHARKSLVRIRLDRWDEGRLRSWQGLEQGNVYHPEAQRANYRVGPHAYLGYGPLDGRGGTRLEKRNAAIQAGESAAFSVAVPEEHFPRMERALWLMDRYGTLGGRSRNGWGSFALSTSPSGRRAGAEGPALRPYLDALDLDWPHAIGLDDRGRPLIWQTPPLPDWKAVMRDLAIVKIGLRTQFVFPSTRPPHRAPEPRHWLSYPITTHATSAWDRGARLPSSLRFKVRQTPEGKHVGVIFHVPCRPPDGFHSNPQTLREVWSRVHALLDECAKPAGQRGYSSISDLTRRGQLGPQLDSITLHRIAE